MLFVAAYSQDKYRKSLRSGHGTIRHTCMDAYGIRRFLPRKNGQSNLQYIHSLKVQSTFIHFSINHVDWALIVNAWAD